MTKKTVEIQIEDLQKMKFYIFETMKMLKVIEDILEDDRIEEAIRDEYKKNLIQW